MKPKPAFALPLLAFSTLAWAVPLDVRPGFWEITARTELPEMAIALPSQTLRRCYTKKDVESILQPGPRRIQDCDIKDQRIQGNRVSWKMECQGATAISGTGSVTVQPTSFAGTIKGRMKQGRATMEMNQSVSGRRIGDCT